MRIKSIKTLNKCSLILLTCTLSYLLTGCKSDPSKPMEGMPAIPVIAAPPTIKEITVYVESVGTLHPSVTMEIRPQVGGTIENVLVDEGESVQPGTPLFQIDPTTYELKVREAKAQLAINQAGLQAAQRKLERFRALAQKDLISQTEWDELEAQVAKAQAAVHLDEARLSSAALDLGNCTLQSSVEGRVGKLDAHPGLLVSGGQTTPLATIAKMDPLTIEFTLTEKEYPKIRSWDTPFEMQPLCSTCAFQTGAITFLDNHFDAKTGLILVRGKIANPEYALRPGQSVRVRIPISVSSNAKLIPQKAIRYNPQGPYVYIVQADNTVVLRQVILGDEDGSDQIVLQGIDPEERIIIDGHLRLSPGSKVEVKS